jgi:uncharacterized protein GlcG (DUF336 family)
MTPVQLATALLLTLALAAGPVYAQAALSSGDAMKAVHVAEAAAMKLKAPLTCTVVDMSGEIVTMHRSDGARAFTTRIAHGKARVSAAFGQPSGAMAKMSGMGLDKAIGEPAFFMQGAVPLMKGGQQVGAIGCSGGTGQQDEDAAKAAAAAF